jgi:hypothetical protein
MGNAEAESAAAEEYRRLSARRESPAQSSNREVAVLTSEKSA